MNTLRCLALLLLFLPLPVFPQSPDEQSSKIRREKIDDILQLQDKRILYDEKLVSYLRDSDATVRERAVLAFGSIQDTSFLNLLVDRFTNDLPAVQSAAAFAIGQTAGQLSRTSKEEFVHDLIWARLEKVLLQEGGDEPAERLIEEIGKFGTETALRDIMLRFGTTNPPPHQHAVTMSIARFAIRNIVTSEAVQYLLKLTKPMGNTPWEVVYALQRIGNHRETRADLDNLIQLYKHRDPLVRINLATLLGKVRDERVCLEPLQKMVDFDPDWRVRVNAFKALSNYDLHGRDDVVRSFRRAFFSGNTSVALTAISAFGSSGLKKSEATPTTKEAFSTLEKITVNDGNEYLWQLQAEAATTAAKLEGKSALAFIHPTDYPQPHLQAQLLVALGMTGAPDAAATLSSYIGSDSLILYRSALEGLQELSKKNPSDTSLVNRTYRASINALGTHDVAVVTTAASILGDSLFLRLTSLEPLVTALEKLNVPDDVEAMQEIASTLSKLGDHRAVDALKRGLHLRDRSVALASVSALKSITQQDYSGEIPKYVEPVYVDLDFKYVHSLPDTVRVKMETSRGNVVMELYKNVAPFTVMSFLKLAVDRGFYRGLTFHRVVPNFVVQGGDPRGDGWGGPGYSIRSEFSPLMFGTGMLGIASAGKDTEGSQFFITQSPQPHLDGRYTIFGRVIAGMDVVDRIQLDDHIFDLSILE